MQSWINSGKNGTNGKSIDWRGEFFSPPLNPLLNWAYRDKTVQPHSSYVYDGSYWQLMNEDGSSATNIGATLPTGALVDSVSTFVDLPIGFTFTDYILAICDANNSVDVSVLRVVPAVLPATYPTQVEVQITGTSLPSGLTLKVMGYYS